MSGVRSEYGDNLIANYRHLIFMAVHFFVIQLPDSGDSESGRLAGNSRLHTRIAGAGCRCRGVPGTPGTFRVTSLPVRFKFKPELRRRPAGPGSLSRRGGRRRRGRALAGQRRSRPAASQCTGTAEAVRGSSCGRDLSCLGPARTREAQLEHLES